MREQGTDRCSKEDRPSSWRARRWPWLLAGLAALGLVWGTLGPLLGDRDGERTLRLSPEQIAMMFRETSREDVGVAGRARLVVAVIPGATVEGAVLERNPALLESLGRVIARQLAAQEEGLAALELRLKRRDGSDALRLRYSPAGDGWDGRGDWQWQILPLQGGN